MYVLFNQKPTSYFLSLGKANFKNRDLKKFLQDQLKVDHLIEYENMLCLVVEALHKG